MRVELFDYELPQKYIAQKPLARRDDSKLLVLDRYTGDVSHDIFRNILNHINKRDVLVLNESKVLKCRLIGEKEKSGAKIECLVLKKESGNRYLVLTKPSKRLRPGTRVQVGKYNFTVESKLDYGRAVVKFSAPIKEIIKKHGNVPLPPYIKNVDFDQSRYQTVYAREEGSTAAPTAGLHFSRKLIGKIKRAGVNIAKVSLEIGLDTFRPISSAEIEDHRIHSENYYIAGEEAEKIAKAKEMGGRVIAVGTTSVRVLETLMAKYGKIKGGKGVSDLYIYPSYEFKIVDAMITNFHLPRSTLLVMVSAFAGRENILKAYGQAKKNNYRFYSLGDCMLIK